ncbi:hypothetical protein E2986_12645 [Frieseomelitta varia]|uniref:Uncharacterized protein n=1 Tax=Frieseomelitta varia TaxID=561572 RepID=A0A833W790_9HYME|nr:hypothetical protein E2986_12645 [Frieseomelitta varia]
MLRNSLTINMDVFEKQYNSYRVVSCIIGLWPYQKTIYTVIKRIFISIILLVNLVFQIMSLLNSEITLRSCVLTLSTTIPFLLFFLRYVNFIEFSSNLKYFIGHMRMEETLLQDLVEVQILTKYVDNGRTCSTGVLTFTAYLLGPIILDLIVPLNEPRTRLIKYLTEFSHDKTVYLDIVALNFVFIIIVGLLCITCTESFLTIFAYYLSGLFKITRYE